MENEKCNLISILKRWNIVVMVCFLSFVSQGKDPEFTMLQSIAVPFEASVIRNQHTSDFRYFLASSREEMAMIDGIDGKVLWHKNFEGDYQNKKFENQFWNKEANVILVYDEDNSKNVATKYFIDGTDGKLLWSSDQYVSDFGRYKLSSGFEIFYDQSTNGILLPTKDRVALVNVRSGEVIWSKPFELSGKAKEFDCAIMEYYDLVKISTGDDMETYYTTSEGEEVDDIEPYFNKKKFMTDRLHARIINIPEKEMYILMQGQTSKALKILGFGLTLPKWKVYFRGYNAATDKMLWSKRYTIAYTFDYVSYEPLIKLFYNKERLYVEHEPNLNNTTGLTVLDVNSGDMLWEAYFTTSENKNSLTKSALTPFPAPDPVVGNGRTYVVNKIKNIVSCYDSETGFKHWDSDKYPDAQKIPYLFFANGTLIMAYGGEAVKCVGETSSVTMKTKYHYEYSNKDKYGLVAYNFNNGKEIWSSESISKSAGDNFSFIAGLAIVDGKLVCATDKNLLALNPKDGKVISALPLDKEKLGDIWKMHYFAPQHCFVLNCQNGIIKVDAASNKIAGTLAIKNVPYLPINVMMNSTVENLYNDYPIITDGDPEKMKIDRFASVDLDQMVLRGVADASIFNDDENHFSSNAEMFYVSDKNNLKIFKIK